MARHLDSLAEWLYTPQPRAEFRIGRDAAFTGYVDTVHETIVAVRVQAQVTASPGEAAELEVVALWLQRLEFVSWWRRARLSVGFRLTGR